MSSSFNFIKTMNRLKEIFTGSKTRIKLMLILVISVTLNQFFGCVEYIAFIALFFGALYPLIFGWNYVVNSIFSRCLLMCLLLLPYLIGRYAIYTGMLFIFGLSFGGIISFLQSRMKKRLIKISNTQ